MDQAKRLNAAKEDRNTGRRSRTTRRKRPIRARTVPIKKMTKEQLKLGRLLYPETDHQRPKTRAECLNTERPCPYVSCKHHLYLDVNSETGSIKLNFPDIEVWQMTETCTLDVTERGGVTLEEVGEIMNLTRERIRQLEMSALTKLLQLEEEDGLNLEELI